MSKQNLALTGFMGTGKTTIGARIAEKTGSRFIDTDQEIMRLTGRTIPEIFRQDGEAAFRNWEKQVIRSLSDQTGLVIATGGGAILDPENRERLLRGHLVVCLYADPAVIEQRIGQDGSRPLAQGWRDRLAQRQAIYDQLPYQIDTSSKTPDEIAEEVIRLWQSYP
ncbi:MAG: shikimate kinase [Anaerolineae bacterium]|nr:shikimate kinase [Anaerolineae bacterium]